MKKGIYEKLKNNMNKVNLNAVLSDWCSTTDSSSFKDAPLMYF